MTSGPMINKCGICTMCCKLLGVTELKKPVNKWCKFCTPGRGCNIYEDRPFTCRDFECGYLLSNLPIEMRPDNLHMVITGEDNKIGAVIVHCDPSYPDAPNSKNGQKLIQLFARMNKSVILITGNKRKLVSSSMKDTQKLQEVLAKYDQELKG